MSALPRRASLVVPGSSPAMLEKARAIVVDEVVIDLEDAVAEDAKGQAREAAVAALSRGFAARTIAVRINAPRSMLADADLSALVSADVRPNSIVVPKVESAHDLAFVDGLLAGRHEPLPVQALVETAAGLRALDEIAAGSSRLESLVLGYADLAASLGRSRAGAANLDLWLAVQDSLLSAARAAGLYAIDGPHLSLDDQGGLLGAATRAANLGFDGKWVIHPSHIPTVTTAFTPATEEVRRARAIIDALENAAARERGAVRHDGQMIDEALRLAADRTLARAEMTRG